jgi:2-hydroxychromene-2-carboxylate isomerase
VNISGPEASFYFDLASPLAYLAAERVLHELPGPARWRPILAARLPHAQSFDSFRCREEEEIFRAELERRTRELQLQPMRWPSRFPFDGTLAMCAATYAAAIGRGVPFAQAAFRQAFGAGRDLSELDSVLIAAAACEMHPNAVKAALKRPALERELHEATREAATRGVRDVPAVSVAGRVFEGERSLSGAAAFMRETANDDSAGQTRDAASHADGLASSPR